MLLCLDVGNSHLYGGILVAGRKHLSFRYPTQGFVTSDQLGIFLRSVLRENDVEPSGISAIAIASVVPHIDHSLRSACIKYFNANPFFLHAGSSPDLTIAVDNPSELGADLLANAIAALDFFPGKNIVVVDFGTATTFCAIGKERVYHGCTIMPGMRLAVEALSHNTAKLGAANIIKATHCVGKTTASCIQAGVYFGHLGAVKEIITRLKAEAFPGEDVLVLGTGGFANLFSNEKLFDKIMPELVLHGLESAWHRVSAS